MPYNRRDQFKHWIRREQPVNRPCTHACCRGYRQHPANYPVILPSQTLRRASDDQLATHFRRVSADDSPRARRAEAQILHEMQRRDDAEEHRKAVAANRAAVRQEREAETQRIRLEAEAQTNGYLVNAKGRARGISDEEMLTGREDVFRRYATDEARDYFSAHPRPTTVYFRGQDTRVHERATEWRRKKRGVVATRTVRRGGRKLTVDLVAA